MKNFTITVILLATLAAASFAQDQQGSQEPKPLGISVKLDYVSTYLWRGTYYFGGDGAFLPSITYDILDTGAIISFAGEFAESYFFEGNSDDQNAVAFANQGLDFGLDYSYTFDESFTLGASFWYCWYFNSGTSWATNEQDLSFLSAKGMVKIDMLPLEPTISLYYDYYPVIDRGGDFYIQLSLGHNFILTDEVSLGVSVSTGYFYMNTAESTTYNVDGTVTRTPLKKGFSDITTVVTMIYKKGYMALNGGFGYVIVPSESWYKGSDIHRFYATFGASANF